MSMFVKNCLCCFKVGESFRFTRLAYGDDMFYQLYMTEGQYDHHPSLMVHLVICPFLYQDVQDLNMFQGSYLGACSHFSALFSTPCLGNSFMSRLEPDVAITLQNIADTVTFEQNWEYPEGTTCAWSGCNSLKMLNKLENFQKLRRP